MEPRTKNDRDNIDRILALARNASSNHSARVTMAARDGGTESFVIRSAFCFASVQVPDVDAAVSSRIIRCELNPQGDFDAKRRNTTEMITAIDRPKRYRLRLFRRLPRMLEDIERARSWLLPMVGDQRQADQWAPLSVATWHLHRDDAMDSTDGREWVRSVGEGRSISSDPDLADEDAVWSLILSHTIEFGQGDRRTVGEALALSDPMAAADGDHGSATMALGRFGLRVLDLDIDGVSKRVLAVAAKASPISAALAGSPYQDGYGAQVKRHDLCIDARQHKIRMTGQIHNSYLLDWDGFVARYLEEQDG
jgi:putative DNA primase/helicase